MGWETLYLAQTPAYHIGGSQCRIYGVVGRGRFLADTVAPLTAIFDLLLLLASFD